MKTFRPEFVEYIPEDLEEGVLYISVPYRIAVHNCFCGCGNKVFTPFIDGLWSLTIQGKTVTLHASIGSANLACRSHYFLTKNNVEWLRPMRTYSTRTNLNETRRSLPKLFGRKKKK